MTCEDDVLDRCLGVSIVEHKVNIGSEKLGVLLHLGPVEHIAVIATIEAISPTETDDERITQLRSIGGRIPVNKQAVIRYREP